MEVIFRLIDARSRIALVTRPNRYRIHRVSFFCFNVPESVSRRHREAVQILSARIQYCLRGSSYQVAHKDLAINTARPSSSDTIGSCLVNSSLCVSLCLFLDSANWSCCNLSTRSSANRASTTTSSSSLATSQNLVKRLIKSVCHLEVICNDVDDSGWFGL